MQGGYDPGGVDAEVSLIEFVDGINCVDDDNPDGFVVKGCTKVEDYGYLISTGEGLKYKAKSADIEFRLIHPWWSRKRHKRGCDNQTDLWSMAAHEVGHVVGLDDSLESSNFWQTMYKVTEACQFRKRNLAHSDWIGLRDISDVP
jgi:Matrixin